MTQPKAQPVLQTEVVYRDRPVYLEPDASLRDCGAEPDKPVLASNVDEGRAYADALTWGRRCKAQLHGTWSSIDASKQTGNKP